MYCHKMTGMRVPDKQLWHVRHALAFVLAGSRARRILAAVALGHILQGGYRAV